MVAVYFLVATGLGLGLVIGIVVKVFGVEMDPRLEQAEELLPGANCGACGFAGCADLARALVAGSADPGLCPSASAAAVESLCSLLGVQASSPERKTALVACGGDDTHAKPAAFYNGVSDCKDAVLVAGGAKTCAYGCLGLGTCSRACPFGAIEITPAGLARVHPDLCTGCGQCVCACPRDLIRLTPAAVALHVFCNSPEKGAAKRKACDAACIGCRKCVKEAEEGQMAMDRFLARVNYENPPDPALAAVCPTHCLHAPLLAEEPAPELEVVNG